MATLKDLVTGALQGADDQIKLAGANPGGELDLDFLKLSAEDGETREDEEDERKKKEAAERKAKEAKAKAGGDEEKRAHIAYAANVVRALEYAAPLVEQLVSSEKVASPLNLPGPKVMPSAQLGSARVPKPAPTAAKPLPSVKGPGGKLPTDVGDFTSPDWTKNKEASLAFIESKTKQANLLVELGQAEQAEILRAEVAEVRTKISQGVPLAIDPAVPSGRVTDNAGMIAMTRGQAKDPTTREVNQRIQQTPTKDPAVAATQMTAAGTKISSVLTKYAKKEPKEDLGKPGYWEESARFNQGMREHKGLNAGAAGLSGALMGGALGHIVGGGPTGKNVVGRRVGAALGATAGGLGLGAMGYHQAKGERAARIRRTEQENA